jgi:hypothetical protein
MPTLTGQRLFVGLTLPYLRPRMKMSIKLVSSRRRLYR